MEARSRFVASIAGAGVALLFSAPVAFAAERFASPSGTSLNPCTLVAPCDIVTAINKASPNDDVTIEPGTYGPLSETLYDQKNTLTIHGQAGAPRPVIIRSAGSPVIALGGRIAASVASRSTRPPPTPLPSNPSGSVSASTG
jgi:uncharacterized protein YbjT (DUF2867 family)